jgi:hypothetical protein
LVKPAFRRCIGPQNPAKACRRTKWDWR